MSETQQERIFQVPQGEAGETLAQVLQANLGMEVSVDSAVGQSCITTQSGLLFAASAQYIVLYDPETGGYLLLTFDTVQAVHFLPGGAQTPAAEAPNTTGSAVQPVAAYRTQAQAAFQYAKRLSQRIE